VGETQSVPTRPGSQSALRSLNQHRVLDVLSAQGETTQAELARKTGLAPATVSNIIRALLSEDVVRVEEPEHGRRLIRLARSAGLVVGMDFGHRHLTVAVADLGHQILAQRRVEFGAHSSADDGLRMAGDMMDDALGEVTTDRSSVLGVGLGLPAPIDRGSGTVGALSILPAWVGVNAGAEAHAAFGVPVVVDNDANLGALAEHTWGACRDAENAVYLKLSEGVGCGLIVGGELFRGRNGTAGEIGHTTIDELGAVCRCGSRGCLETRVSARSVIELLEPLHGPGLTVQDVVNMATSGDHACARVLSDTGRQVGIAAANLCNLFNPEVIVVGGELALAGDMLLGPLREAVRRSGLPSATADLQAVPATLGARAHVMGAISLAIRSSQLAGSLGSS